MRRIADGKHNLKTCFYKIQLDIAFYYPSLISSTYYRSVIELLYTEDLPLTPYRQRVHYHHHAPLTSAVEACLCCLSPGHPAPATRSKPSAEARTPSPEPRTATISRANILPPEVRCTVCTQTRHTASTSAVLPKLFGLRNLCVPWHKTASLLQRLLGNVVILLTD